LLAAGKLHGVVIVALPHPDAVEQLAGARQSAAILPPVPWAAERFFGGERGIKWYD